MKANLNQKPIYRLLIKYWHMDQIRHKKGRRRGWMSCPGIRFIDDSMISDSSNEMLRMREIHKNDSRITMLRDEPNLFQFVLRSFGNDHRDVTTYRKTYMIYELETVYQI